MEDIICLNVPSMMDNGIFFSRTPSYPSISGGVMCGGSPSSQCPFNDRQWRLPLPLELPHIYRYLYWGDNNKYPPIDICPSALKACPHLSLETIRRFPLKGTLGNQILKDFSLVFPQICGKLCLPVVNFLGFGPVQILIFCRSDPLP